MKKITYLIALILLPFIASAQQTPMYSQYIWNAYLINPAIGGAENFLEFKSGYRSQWVGLEGAPKTLFISGNGQLGKKIINREDIDVVNRDKQDKKPVNRLARALGYKKPAYPEMPSNYKLHAHHGVGGQLIGDQIGPFSTLAIYASYAFHLPVSRKVYASMGTFVGVKQFRLAIDKVTLDQQGDNAISSQGDMYGLTPDAVVGMMLYSTRWYAGVSMNQVLSGTLSLKQKMDAQVVARAGLEPHFFLTGGYRFRLSSELALIPSTLVRYFPGTAPAVDVTAKLNYMDLIWLGSSFRAGDAAVFLVGFTYANRLDFGYSYDMSANSRNQDIRIHSHEVMIGYRIVNKKFTGKPSYVW